MFDALKRLSGRQQPPAPSQIDEVQGLLAEVRKEREALTAALDRVKLEGGRVSETAKALTTANVRAGEVGARLDTVSARLGAAEASVAAVGALGAKVDALVVTVRETQQAAERFLAPDGELQKQRQVVQQLSANALQARATLDTLAEQQHVLDALRLALTTAAGELQSAGDQVTKTSSQIESLRAAAAAAAKDEERLRDLARESRDDVAVVASTARDLEQRLQRFTDLQDAAVKLDERLAAQSALAEHVMQKSKILENQKRTIEHAIVEAHRLGEMVTAMDSQISRLTDGGQRALRVEENVERVERLVRESGEHLDQAMRTRDLMAADLVRLDRDRATLIEFGKKYEERIAGERRALDASQVRIAGLEDAVAALERSQQAVAARDHELAEMAQRLTALTIQLSNFDERTQGFGEKVQSLEVISQDLSRVDEMSRRVTWQMESLKTARQDLDDLRTDIQAFYVEHASAVQLRDRLAADRAALEAFLERMGAFAGQLPELDARMNAVKSKLSSVDEGTQKAANLVAIADDLDRHMTRLTGYQQFVERIEGRLNTLNSLTMDVDHKLEEQIARRAEAEALRSLCESVSLQATDLKQRLEGVSHVQSKLLPITTQVATLKSDVERAQERLAGVLRDQTELTNQEKRISAMLEAARTLTGEMAERLAQVEGLTSALSRSETVKESLLKELSVVQARQRDVAGQLETTDAHLKDNDAAFRKLEQRRDQLVFAEKRMGAFETTVSEWTARVDQAERRMRELAAREDTVLAIRKEVDGVHQASAQSKTDLAYLEAHRGEVISLRATMDEVLATAQATEERLSDIRARKRAVDEVALKVNVITAMLGDVRVNLETVGEQKAILDHVLESLSTLSTRVSEAQSTLRSLQAERELAERIAQGIKSLRVKTTVPEDRKRA